MFKNYFVLLNLIFTVLISYSQNTFSPNNLQKDSMFIYRFNSSMDSFLISKNYYSYNSNKNEMSQIGLNYDNIIKKWVNSYKYSYTNNSDSLMISSKSYSWDKNTSTWKITILDSVAYDENKRKLFLINQSVYGDTMIYEYQYLNNEFKKIMVQYRVVNQLKVPSYKTETFIDSIGNEIVKNGYSWVDEKWKKHSVIECNYNLNQILSELNFEYYDTNLVLSQKRIFQYNSNNQLSTQILMTKNDQDSLINNTLHEINYDQYGIKNLETYFSWDTLSKSWLYTNHTKYVNDSLGNLIDIREYHWSSGLKTYKPISHYFFYFNPKPILTGEVEQDSFIDFQIFPNPVNDYIQIKSLTGEKNQIEIFDLNGNLCLRYENLNKNLIPIHTLKQGMFVLKIQSEKFTYTSKFIKQ